MGSTCNTTKTKSQIPPFFERTFDKNVTISEVLEFEPQKIIKHPAKTKIVKSFNLLLNNMANIREFQDTLTFLTSFSNEKQKMLVNDILIKPFQLKINRRASKYLPEIFSSQYETYFARTFPYIHEQNGLIIPLFQKKNFFTNFNKEILDNVSKISKLRRLSNENTKTAKVITRTKDSIKLRKEKSKDSAELTKEKSELVPKSKGKIINVSNRKPQIKNKPKQMKKSQSISHFPKKEFSNLKINLIPLIQIEKKTRADTYLKKKVQKKLSVSSQKDNNKYYVLFSYAQNNQIEEKFKKKSNVNVIQPKKIKEIMFSSGEIFKRDESSDEPKSSSSNF